jgi:hypothetical protein
MQNIYFSALRIQPIGREFWAERHSAITIPWIPRGVLLPCRVSALLSTFTDPSTTLPAIDCGIVYITA